MTTNQNVPSSRVVMQEIAPKLADITNNVLFGDIWERTELSKRDRSLITLASLIAMYRSDQIRVHIRRGLENGLTQEEIVEVITHMAFYAGWPTAANAIVIAKEVFDESA
jgi:4-carboxymuconolactone decarboxylase